MESVMLLGLTVAFLVLLVPYIMHYYLLENETQKMYVQYDNILVHIQTAKIGRELQQEE